MSWVLFLNTSGMTAKHFEKWLLLWTKVEKNLWFLLLDQFINDHISIIFLDWALKFGVWFDNTYQFALVAAHTTEYFACIYAKSLNMGYPLPEQDKAEIGEKNIEYGQIFVNFERISNICQIKF